MNAIAVNATDFSRGLSDYLNQVQYKNQVFEIERGKRVIARVSPAVAATGFPLVQLDDLLAKGPHLPGEDVQTMADELQAVRSRLLKRADPWAS